MEILVLMTTLTVVTKKLIGALIRMINTMQVETMIMRTTMEVVPNLMKEKMTIRMMKLEEDLTRKAQEIHKTQEILEDKSI